MVEIDGSSETLGLVSLLLRGVPGMEPQKHRVYFSRLLGTAYGSMQFTEFAGQWFDTVWQILVVLSVPVDCHVPVVCECLRTLPYHSRIPPFRNGRRVRGFCIFNFCKTLQCKATSDGFIKILHITRFMALKLVSTGLGIKGRKNLFSRRP